MMLPIDPCGAALDWARACHQSILRIPGVGLVPVQWYFTDRPWLPLEHVYGLWKWHRLDATDEEWDDNGPGEVTTLPQPFVIGDPPPAMTCTGPKGSPAAWRGEDTGERYLVQGFPAGPFGRAYSWGYSLGYS